MSEYALLRYSYAVSTDNVVSGKSNPGQVAPVFESVD